MRVWFSGRTRDFQSFGPGSIPGTRSMSDFKKEREVSSLYNVIPVDRKTIQDFMRANPREKNQEVWVTYGEIKWAKEHALFTYGASTCLVPVFINKMTNEIGLGHLAYFDRSKTMLPLSEEELLLQEARKKIQKTNQQWEMFLFGGGPIRDDEKYRSLAATNAQKVIGMFNDIGVTCHDKAISSYNSALEALIVDQMAKEIKVDEVTKINF